MTEDVKEKAQAAAVASVGAGVGGAGRGCLQRGLRAPYLVDGSFDALAAQQRSLELPEPLALLPRGCCEPIFELA